MRPQQHDATDLMPGRRPHPLAAALLALVAGVTMFVAAGPAHAAKAKSTKPAKVKINPYAAIELYAVNEKETLQLRLRDDKGRPVRNVQKRFDRFLRCHHTNKVHAMSPRLVRVLYQVGKHFPGRRLEVVSGYRHPSVAKNPRSPHMKGLACDFRVTGIKNTELRDYLRSGFQKVGVGYYPNSSFVHLDMRKDRSAFWIDYSGPGERAIYSENAQGDVKSGRADTYKPTTIDSNWAAADEGGGDDGSDETPVAAGQGPVGPVAPDEVNKRAGGGVEPAKAEDK